MDIYQDLSMIVWIDNINVNEYLKDMTYTKLGGQADYLLKPITVDQISQIVRYSNDHNIPITIIGNGSNLIIRDGGIRGIVITLQKLNNISRIDNELIIQAGVNIKTASKYALENSLTGFEFACGIPGTIGGGIYMNAGAYGGEFKDIIKSVLVIDKFGNLINKTNVDLNFDYRYSSIQDTNNIIIGGTFTLKSGIYSDIKTKMNELTSLRQNKQPLEYPSCGSVFKRPVGYYAGKLIEDSNLQGYRIGGAEVSKKHAGFIVNIDNATALEYIKLIDVIQETVKAKFNVNLEREVKIIGEDLSH